MEINEILYKEYNLYFKSDKDYLKEKILNTNKYRIWQWQKALRMEEYYSQKNMGIINKLFLVYWKRRKNYIGRQLGFDIPGGVFAIGLRIWHPAPIVVNPFAKVGENAVIVGNLCIGNNNGKMAAAQIGNNCTFGWGCAVIGDIKVSDNCKIGAGAIVVRDVIDDNSVLVGVPAKNIRK